MRVYGYVRVSTKGQLDGDGPERQTLAIKAFCAKHGLELVKIWQESISGTVEGLDRPEFLNMTLSMRSRSFEQIESDQSDIPAGLPIEAVIVERMDRIARDLMVSEMMLRELYKRGAKLFACDQGELIDLANESADPTRKLIRQVLGAVAEWEKAMLLRKLSAARARKREQDGVCGGMPAYGSLPGETEVIGLIREMHMKGYSFSTIAETLKSGGIVNRRGKHWYRQDIWRILKTDETFAAA